MKKSKLVLPTYDAQLTELKIKPKHIKTKISYKLKLYDETLKQTVTKTLLLEGVIAIDFSMNFFDNPIGAEVCGFYEIFAEEEKKRLIEQNFLARREGFLYHGDYDYDEKEENDILNYRPSIEKVLKNIEQYHLYQQETTGGLYSFLTEKEYTLL